MRRVSRLILIALGVIALGGCPRELEPPPAAGDPCATETDCNPSGVACGALRLCVGGHCEAGQSLHVPCR